jgi:LPS-assembly protein
MRLRRDRCLELSQRRLGAVLAAILLALFMLPGTAMAQLLPEGFFDHAPPSGAPAQIEADILSYDGQRNEISAEGDVIMRADGYVLRGERLVYNQGTGDLRFVGRVAMRDPGGTIYELDSIEVTGGLKKAFVESLTITTPDGGVIKAGDADYSSTLEIILTDAHYSPCGLCIDKKGRRIGWKVNASKIVYNRDDAVVYLEGAGIEVLGVPIAWVPFLIVPDPSQPRARGFRMPRVDYDPKFGARLDAPFFVPISDDIDLTLTPTLMSRQGGLMTAEWVHRFPYGEYDIRASGLYQLDPSAFAGTVGDTNWRGAVQTTGRFQPLENWQAGWSYTAFTDAAYLIDYKLQSSKNNINEVYATHLSRDYFFDIRARQFNLLGNVTPLQQEQHARAIPSIEAASYYDLGEWGDIELSGELLGVQRGADSQGTYGGVPYTFAYRENKVHGMVQASWQNQYILPTGIVATPYLGLRADAAYYDGSSALLAGPVSLLDATPIAAMDIRWPLIATSGPDSHLFEPAVQLVYRGSDTTLVGITNDDAQSFVFDDTLLFSYNRFSGTDRQETGLRANVGGRYMANFAGGAWLQVIGGRSFHLAGPNALGVIDTAQTGNSTGLENPASDYVLGVSGSPLYGLQLGAKAQLDGGSFAVKRAGIAAGYTYDVYSGGIDYIYSAANSAVGAVQDQHEVTGRVSAPLPLDYWFADASLSWDIANNQFLEATGALTYDDKYFAVSGYGTMTGPTHYSSPNSTTFGLRVKLRSGVGEFSF